MKRKKIIKILQQTSEDEDDSLAKEIALGAMNTDDPIDFLIESYQDASLIYDFDESFFDDYYDEIETLRLIHIRKYDEQVDIGYLSLKIGLSWFAYQEVLKKLLYRFGLMEKRKNTS